MPISFSFHDTIFEDGDDSSDPEDMLEDVIPPDREKKVPSKEFLPYSCNVLTKPLMEYAAKYLNESEETRITSLAAVKKFLKEELEINYEPEEILLLCFLRSRKFDIDRTCSLLKSGAEFADSYRYIFDRVDSDVVRQAIESKTIGFLPYRDARGRAIVFLRAECWNPDEIKAKDIIFGSVVALHVAGENNLNQVAGFVVIMDLQNLTFQQVITMSSWLIFGVQALQKFLPALVKEIHITHSPGVFRICWKIVKPFLSDKIRNRIIFYKSSHWDSLHRRIPKAILPEELGGELGPYSYEHWAYDLPSIEKRYNKRMRMFMDRKIKP